MLTFIWINIDSCKRMAQSDLTILVTSSSFVYINRNTCWSELWLGKVFQNSRVRYSKTCVWVRLGKVFPKHWVRYSKTCDVSRKYSKWLGHKRTCNSTNMIRAHQCGLIMHTQFCLILIAPCSQTENFQTPQSCRFLNRSLFRFPPTAWPKSCVVTERVLS